MRFIGLTALLLCAGVPAALCFSLRTGRRALYVARASAARQAVTHRDSPSPRWRLFQAPINESDSPLNPVNATTGIGGLDGVVYDVNLLKRNIVQETVGKFKEEIWNLLGDPIRDDVLLEDKLAALVQTSPVITTTDSNLLDGHWKYVFGSRKSASSLLDSRRFDIDLQHFPKTSLKASDTDGTAEDGLFRSSSRDIHLENVEDDEDSYVLDRTKYLGGLVQRTCRYHIERLTRTTLDLALAQKRWTFLGDNRRWGPTASTEMKKTFPRAVRVLYVDSDLCIVTSSNDLTKSAFQVYTRNEAFLRQAHRVHRRLLSSLRLFNVYLHSLVHVFQRVATFFSSSGRSPQVSVDSPGVLEIPGSRPDAQVRVVALGDWKNEQDAWEGDEDPFAHLTADERQSYLKKMRVRDVTKAGRRLQRRNKRKNVEKRLDRHRHFKKPN